DSTEEIPDKSEVKKE
ncbi:MAG: hypothetical protein QG611_533, partial [Bacteroidota bacterium]|nr:hypothetical protein [Bacteroidota bacterium]